MRSILKNRKLYIILGAIALVFIIAFLSHQRGQAKGEAFATKVIESIRDNDLEKLEKVLAANTELINERTVAGRSPAVIFCRTVEQLELFMRYGADLSRKDERGATPIYFWCLRGNIAMVELAIEHGAQLCHSYKYGTPLHSAAKSDNPDMVEFIARHCPDLVNKKSTTGTTPLMEAVLKELSENAHLLIEHGANVNLGNATGETALHLAARVGSKEAARVLLSVDGCEIDVYNNTGDTPLHLAAGRGNPEFVRILLENGARADISDVYGFTPLHGAAAKGCVDSALILLKHGAEVDAENLSVAAYFGHVDIASLLIEHGADVDAKDHHGRTPLGRAAKKGEVDMAHLLLNHGADLNLKDEHGKTPLDWAKESGNTKIFEILRQYEEEIN